MHSQYYYRVQAFRYHHFIEKHHRFVSAQIHNNNTKKNTYNVNENFKKKQLEHKAQIFS